MNSEKNKQTSSWIHCKVVKKQYPLHVWIFDTIQLLIELLLTVQANGQSINSVWQTLPSINFKYSEHKRRPILWNKNLDIQAICQ